MEKKELRKGYTTGTCAAIAAKAAVKMIFTGEKVYRESVLTPKGITITTDIQDISFTENSARCAVIKDGGDDPDVTTGAFIYAEVILCEGSDIVIDGGEGVGRVTKPGLWQAVGEAAINKVPRQMIRDAVKRETLKHGYNGGIKIVISVPEGEKLAKKTFNPRLGIVGGISILGTSGIVEPMSEQALIDTIHVEIDVRLANDGEYIMMAPGNYGVDFIRETYNADLNRAVKCSNFVGEALDYAKYAGAKGILLIGHIGKFVKLAGGIMNTHSHNADSRMEIIAANASMVTDDISVIRNIMGCVTTDEAIRYCKEAGILEAVMKRIVDKAVFYTSARVQNEIEIGMVIFSNEHGILGQSEKVDELFERMGR